jgi:serine/threonine protein kinase
MSNPSQSGRSSHSAGLLLRVQRSDGPLHEFYLAPGLTIGRTLANTIALPDDATVDRTHARVESADDGTATLRCVELDGTLTVNGKAVRELSLGVGVQFRIGKTEFECVPGQRAVDRATSSAECACPYCGATDVPVDGEGVRPCPACHELILPVPLDPQSSRSVLLPADYHDFRAHRFVARGGMGLVLKGVRRGSDEPVAIKVLFPGMIDDQRDAEFFEREVATMARVRHPGVVQLLDHGRSGRFSFLVLEWIEGPSLRQVIAHTKVGEVKNFASAYLWFEQVCKGLAAIHAAGLVHRDLKPSNILFGPDRTAKIADFGIAKPLDAEASASTETGHAPGTFAYMAPEQWSAPDTVDGRADLYALGVTFYELFTGTRPVGAWPPTSELNRTVPGWFDNIIRRLLAQKPSDRFADVHEVLASIELAKSTYDSASADLVRKPSSEMGPLVANENDQNFDLLKSFGIYLLVFAIVSGLTNLGVISPLWIKMLPVHPYMRHRDQDRDQDCDECSFGKIKKSCFACFGRGYYGGVPCNKCNGSGKVEENCRFCGGSGKKPTKP